MAGRGHGRGHVRLRDAHAQCAQRSPVHPLWRPEACATPANKSDDQPDRTHAPAALADTAGQNFSRAYLHHLDRCGEMLGPMLDHHPQPALLPEPDAGSARCAGRRHASPPSSGSSTPTAHAASEPLECPGSGPDDAHQNCQLPQTPPPRRPRTPLVTACARIGAHRVRV